MKDVTDRLLPDKAKYDEFEVFLSHRGGTSEQKGSSIIHEGGRLIVDYKKDHQIASIRVADDYEESALRELEEQAVNAVSHAGTDVAQRYLHCMYATTGYFRYGDDFQIIPSPPDAAQPTFLHAPHSFLLEYRFPKSPNALVSRHRAARRFSELSFLLNALIRAIVLPRNTGAHEWVVIPGEKFESQYLSVGYTGGREHRTKNEDGFSSVEGLEPLEQVEAQSYYAQFAIVSGDQHRIPDTLQSSLEAYDRLSPAEQVKFCRASYWSQVSYQVFTMSQSASFAALVSAIEVFLPDPESRCKGCGRPTGEERCEHCNQPLAGPTRQFRDFVDKYVPGIPAAQRNRLYSRRSSLSHGSSLLPGDLAEIGFRFTPEQNESWQERLQLSEIVQLIFVNWLQNSVSDS